MLDVQRVWRKAKLDFAVCSTVPQPTAPLRAPISKEYNMEIATKRRMYFFLGGVTDHLSTKIIINDEILEQVNQFTYLGCR